MVDFWAGMVPTADELQSLIPVRVSQGTNQEAASSTTLRDSAISIPIDGPCEVTLQARYQYASASTGGGIRWAWGSTGTVTSLARTAISPGSGAGSGGSLVVYDSNHNFTGVRMRQIAGLTEEHVIAHYSTSTTQWFSEELVLEGVGELILRFAQQSSNANGVVLHANSYAIRSQIRTL